MVMVDGIGVCNADVRLMREQAATKLADAGIENDIVAINVNSTHCHTVIDTQGFGLAPLIKTVFQNLFSFLPFIDKTRSIDSEFHELMINGAADAIVEAYKNMESGEQREVPAAEVAESLTIA